MIGYFLSNQQSNFYNTDAFGKVLQYLQKNTTTCLMKEKETKAGLCLLITCIKIDTIRKTLEVF